MTVGQHLVMAVAMLGAGVQASGAGEPPPAPDTLATQVLKQLHQHYPDHDKLAVLDRIFSIEKRIGAYRAARSRAELTGRLNADLWVAIRDRRVCVGERSWPVAPGVHTVTLDGDLWLFVPGTSPRTPRDPEEGVAVP